MSRSKPEEIKKNTKPPKVKPAAANTASLEILSKEITVLQYKLGKIEKAQKDSVTTKYNNSFGRKTKLTKAMIKDICFQLSQGRNIKTTCELLGIWESTWNRWKNRGEAIINIDETPDITEEEIDKRLKEVPEEEHIFWEFCKSVRRARAVFKASQIDNVRRAGTEGKWQASTWLLEKMFPNEFGAKPSVISAEFEESGGGTPTPEDERVIEVKKKMKLTIQQSILNDDYEDEENF
jgi:hypothetical protein